MCEIIKKEVNEIKKDLVKHLAMYSLGKDSSDNNLALLDSVLIAWLDDVNTEYEFKEKYDAFNNLLNMENMFYLFNLINIIEKTETGREEKADVSIRLYNKIINDPTYQKLSSNCGYELTKDFSQKENYLDSTLYNNLQFLKLFQDELSEINKSITKKENFVL